jgi:uncharacterized protein YcbK (DUF882 family)
MNRRSLIAMVACAAALPLTAHALPRPAAVRRLHLVNPHTGETFDGPYRDGKGPIADAVRDLDAFLRDFHSGEKTQMDVGVLDFLADLLDGVGETKATVLSAYRTPETNAMLARTMFGVAEHSQHLYGRALDISLGSKLAQAMGVARAMQRGGVGWYPNSNFIHIDTGPVRNWTLDGTGFENLLLFDGSRLHFQGPRRPLSVAQRLALQRQLAHAEFIARHH